MEREGEGEGREEGLTGKQKPLQQGPLWLGSPPQTAS